ncbi:MAG: ribokinase [Elainellaceae cyanobacterium]
MTILVFGSINMDLVARTPRLPQAGETLTGHNFSTVPGGKGANQAVAAARLGAAVTMIGRVGGDRFGETLIESLQKAGVGCDRIIADSACSSGVALIEVEDGGNNHIIIIPGANGRVNAEDVSRLQPCLPEAKLLLLQLEVPIAAVVAAAQAARQAGVTVVLDPAPAPTTLPDELFTAVDIITPNQVEASQLVGFAVETLADAEKAAIALRQKGVRAVIIKLGNQGTLTVTEETTIHTPVFPVKAVDTVAAGDAFNGGLATALAEGRSLQDALIWGTGTAALAVTRQGAQTSMPTHAELYQFFNTYELTLHREKSK